MTAARGGSRRGVRPAYGIPDVERPDHTAVAARDAAEGLVPADNQVGDLRGRPEDGETAAAAAASDAARTLSAKWPGARKYDATATRKAPASSSAATASAGPGEAADA